MLGGLLLFSNSEEQKQAGAPSYPVFTGRRDGMTSSASSVDIPSPSISLEKATAYFKSKGLDVLDMTTLLGKYAFHYQFYPFFFFFFFF